jgi:mono/diheme cytochrome c family protein
MTARTLAVATALMLATGHLALAADGAAIYKSRCASCHGDTGHADSPAAKAMKAPAIAANAAIAGTADADLIKKIKETKQHAALKSLTDDDLAAVTTYVKSLAGGK